MRKSPYTGLWMLLAVALAAFVGMSLMSPMEFDWGSVQQVTFVDELLAGCDSVWSSEQVDTVSVDTVEVEEHKQAELDTVPKNILFIGDSMLEGLSPRLAAYAKLNGHKLHTVIWYSSTSEVWGSCDTLRHFIRRFKPDYIFVCLGANELFVRDIAKKRAKYVDHILEQIGDIPYVWIGPPNWKPDTGINDLVSSKVADGSYFMSNGMTFDRAKDGAHPTRRSAGLWMDSVARWMGQECAHPILMEMPEVGTTERAGSVTVLQPE